MLSRASIYLYMLLYCFSEGAGFLLELLAVPTAAMIYAFSCKKNKKIEDPFQDYFQAAKFFVKESDQEKYPFYLGAKKMEEAIYYCYRLPIGITSDQVKRVGDVIVTSYTKRVHIQNNKGEMTMKVFLKELPEKVNFDESLCKKDTWIVPIGKTLEGHLYHNFEKNPHIVIGGMTDKGKSVLLRNIFGTLIFQQGEKANFYFIDLKGGLEFNEFQNVKQVKGIAKNAGEALVFLRNIKQNIESKMQELEHERKKNIQQLGQAERHFIVVDEAAELAIQKNMSKSEKALVIECQSMLSFVARIGRAAGYRLVYATQYPTEDTLPRQIKQNADTRIGFRLATTTASRVVLDEGGLEELPDIKGRIIYKRESKVEAQSIYMTESQARKIVKGYEVDGSSKKGSELEKESTTNRDTFRIG